MSIAIGDFQDAFERNLSHYINRDKKIEAIEDYFYDKYEIRVNFEKNVDKCLEFIMSYALDEEDYSEEEIFNDVLEILEKKYSVGEPFSLSLLEVNPDVTFEVLLDKVNEEFEGKAITIEDIKFDEINIGKDLIGKKIFINCKFNELKRNSRTNEIEDGVKLYGSLGIVIDYNNSVVICTKTSYNKAVHQIFNVLKYNLMGFCDIKPYYVRHKVRGNKASYAYDNLSLIILNLIHEQLSSHQYGLLDVVSLNFNNNLAPRIKNAKLGGVNLLQDMDIVARIHNKDKITSFAIKVEKEQSNQTPLRFLLTVDFRGTLKINIDDLEGSLDTARDLSVIAYEIYHIISTLVPSEEAVEQGKNIFERTMLQPLKPNPILNMYKEQIKKDLLELLPDKSLELEAYFS